MTFNIFYTVNCHIFCLCEICKSTFFSSHLSTSRFTTIFKCPCVFRYSRFQCIYIDEIYSITSHGKSHKSLNMYFLFTIYQGVVKWTNRSDKQNQKKKGKKNINISSKVHSEVQPKFYLKKRQNINNNQKIIIKWTIKKTYLYSTEFVQVCLHLVFFFCRKMLIVLLSCFLIAN